jgi:hypothetical protein
MSVYPGLSVALHKLQEALLQNAPRRTRRPLDEAGEQFIVYSTSNTHTPSSWGIIIV